MRQQKEREREEALKALKTNATVTTLHVISARRPYVRGVHSVLGV